MVRVRVRGTVVRMVAGWLDGLSRERGGPGMVCGLWFVYCSG